MCAIRERDETVTRPVQEIVEDLHWAGRSKAPPQIEQAKLIDLAKACLNELDLKDEGAYIERAIHLQGVAKILRAIMTDLDLDKAHRWSVGYAYHPGTLNKAYVSIDSPTLSELKQVRYKLSMAGYTLKEHSSDSIMKRELWYLENDVILQAWFYAANSTCKYIKVGEKIEDVMELQCEDGTPSE